MADQDGAPRRPSQHGSYLGYLFDDSFLVLPSGHIALAKVYHEHLKASGAKAMEYPAREELRIRTEFCRQLCDGALAVQLLNEDGSLSDVNARSWSNEDQFAAALTGWHARGDGGAKSIFVCSRASEAAWRGSVIAERQTRATVFSPYLVVMMKATEELAISETNSLNKTKDVAPALVRIWDREFPHLHGQMSTEESERMATFVRWPDAKKGTGSANNVKRKKPSSTPQRVPRGAGGDT